MVAFTYCSFCYFFYDRIIIWKINPFITQYCGKSRNFSQNCCTAQVWLGTILAWKIAKLVQGSLNITGEMGMLCLFLAHVCGLFSQSRRIKLVHIIKGARSYLDLNFFNNKKKFQGTVRFIHYKYFFITDLKKLNKNPQKFHNKNQLTQ